MRSFSEARHLNLANICFMGDDVNDLGALKIAGFATAPADAHQGCAGSPSRKYGNRSKPAARAPVRELLRSPPEFE